MLNQEWEILLVDDEPDVLSISQLALKGFQVYGLPFKIHTAESKAEVLELLEIGPDRHPPLLAVAFIDVVMESDTAGLELCQHIREDMGNRITQLYVRTGQPGIAPERAVIDRYAINGYFTKVETTEDKLYSLVKSGVRQFLWSKTALEALALLNGAIAGVGSREKIEESFRDLLTVWDRTRMALSSESGDKGIGVSLMIGDRVIATKGWIDEKIIKEKVALLDQIESRPMSLDGDKYTRDEYSNRLIKIAAGPSNPEVNFFFKTAFELPDYFITMFHSYLKGIAILWQQAS